MADYTEQRFDYSGGRPDAPELILMVGVSGSGKSTLAKAWVNRGRGNIARLNRDSLRSMLHVDVPFAKKLEDRVKTMQHETARAILQAGGDVIIDDTNCIRQTRQKWEEFAQTMRVKFRIVTMSTDLDTCIRRDKERSEPCPQCGKPKGVMVGEGIVRRQYKDLHTLKVEAKEKKEPPKLTRPYFERDLLRTGGFVPRLPNAPWVLIDVDGTVACHEGVRNKFDESRVLHDTVYSVVADWVRALYPHYNICIVSGRHDWCGDDTCDWLEMHGIPFDRILMRRSGDNRSDVIAKQEILDELRAVLGTDHGVFVSEKDFNPNDEKPIFSVPPSGIAFVLDDRPRVVEMWRSNGIPAFTVRGGWQHSENCGAGVLHKGYGICPDCGALEYF